jgi:hypothetical protein
MLTGKEIYECIQQTMDDKLPFKELQKIIEEQEFIMTKNVWNQLDSAFSFEHEVSFSLYSSGNIADLAIDYTDYESYRNAGEHELFSINRDEKRYKQDIQKFSEQGIADKGQYHTHPPYTSFLKEENKRFIVRFEKGYEKVRSRINFPSGGDILSWCCHKERSEYLLIGQKSKPTAKLNIGAYIPIADFDFIYDSYQKSLLGGENGNSVLKPVVDNWIKDTKITREEINAYKRKLGPLLTIRSVIDKIDSPFMESESYFIEIPVRIQK